MDRTKFEVRPSSILNKEYIGSTIDLVQCINDDMAKGQEFYSHDQIWEIPNEDKIVNCPKYLKWYASEKIFQFKMTKDDKYDSIYQLDVTETVKNEEGFFKDIFDILSKRWCTANCMMVLYLVLNDYYFVQYGVDMKHLFCHHWIEKETKR